MLEEDVFEISDIVSVCVLGWKKKKKPMIIINLITSSQDNFLSFFSLCDDLNKRFLAL